MNPGFSDIWVLHTLQLPPGLWLIPKELLRAVEREAALAHGNIILERSRPKVKPGLMEPPVAHAHLWGGLTSGQPQRLGAGWGADMEEVVTSSHDDAVGGGRDQGR